MTKTTTTSPLVNSLLTGDREGIGGILCNDTTGLCLSSQGEMGDVSKNSGTYTNLVRLASQLQPAQSSDAPPLITIETDDTATLVKEYDGNTVTMKVPMKSAMMKTEDSQPAE